jgi:UTP--glucose-1-phosphate uridylyltransferase
MKISKAIIPVAGYGTRRLPITKALEKNMLPVGNRPIIDYVVQDCIAAGIRDFYFVVGEQSSQLRIFYGHNQALEDHLRAHNKEHYIEQIQPPKGCTFHYIVQDSQQPYGTAVPVWLARDVIDDDEHALVIMGDQFFYHKDGHSEAAWFMGAVQRAGTPAAMLAVEVPREEVSRYGIVATTPAGDFEHYDHIVDRPTVEEASSNLNNASFYLFNKQMIDEVTKYMQVPREGEYMLTDPINTYADAGNKVAVIRAQGQYLDCGTVEGWLHANEVIHS